MYAIPRFLVYAFFTNPGRICLGILLLTGGIIYGLGSKNVTYQQVSIKNYALYSDSRNVDYTIQDTNTELYYQTSLTDFTSDFTSDFTDEYAKTHLLSLVYTPNYSEQTSLLVGDGTEIKVTGYQILKLTFLDNQGKVTDTFPTTQYQKHPQPYNENHWIAASILWAIGLLFILFSWLVTYLAKLFFIRRDKQRGQLSEQEIASLYANYTKSPWNNRTSFRKPPDFIDMAK